MIWSLSSVDGYELADQENDLLERRTRRSGMLLSTAELVGLVHVPASSVRTEQVRVVPGRSKAAPPDLLAEGTHLGENVHRGRSATVRLPTATRLRHLHVVGATGTGKSTLLRSLIREDVAAGRGVALLDPHGDLADEVVSLVPPERAGDVIYLDPSDEAFPIGFNILAARTDRERNLLASDLCAIFRRFSTTWGDQMTAVLTSAVMALLECGEPKTLLDLRRFLGDRAFRESVLATVTDPLLLNFWREEFPRLPGARSQLPITNRLDAFLRPRSIRNMMAQSKSRLDLRRVLDERGILIAKLSQGAIGIENAHLLGSLLVAKIHQLAMSREDLPEASRAPFFVYLDEFHHFLSPSLTSLLSGARKYGVGLVLAHQELRQLTDPELRGAVLANPATRVCFRLGDEDARLLAGGFASFAAEDLVNLAVGQAICRVGQSSRDFNLRVRAPEAVDVALAARRRDLVREATRLRYGTPQQEVEALIAASWGAREEPAEPSSLGRPPRSPAKVESTVQTLHPVVVPPPAQEATKATDEPSPVVAPEPVPHTAGRGGAQHKYLQGFVKQAAEERGYRATIEAPLEPHGRADVLLVRGDERIAVEISITTGTGHELENLKKCLAAEVTEVVVLAPVAATLARIREAAINNLAEAVLARVRFALPEEFVEGLQAPADTGPRTVRGYRVKTTLAASGPNAPASQRSEVAKIVAGAVRRLRRK